MNGSSEGEKSEEPPDYLATHLTPLGIGDTTSGNCPLRIKAGDRDTCPFQLLRKKDPATFDGPYRSGIPHHDPLREATTGSHVYIPMNFVHTSRLSSQFYSSWASPDSSLLHFSAALSFGESLFDGDFGVPSSGNALWYRAPANNWVLESLPIGNGYLGAYGKEDYKGANWDAADAPLVHERLAQLRTTIFQNGTAP
ncbi:15330_t:CDS:2, partial [Acaulospora colombiana]